MSRSAEILGREGVGSISPYIALIESFLSQICGIFMILGLPKTLRWATNITENVPTIMECCERSRNVYSPSHDKPQNAFGHSLDE